MHQLYHDAVEWVRRHQQDRMSQRLMTKIPGSLPVSHDVHVDEIASAGYNFNCAICHDSAGYNNWHADGGSGSDLRQITVEVGYDLDGSNTLEAQEVDVTLATLVARRW